MSKKKNKEENVILATQELAGDVSDDNPMESIGEDENDALAAYFDIHDGKTILRVRALRGCWAIQKFCVSKNAKTGVVTEEWRSFKYVTDLGSVANRIFNWRLKNSEVTTLQEISVAAKQIRDDVRKEFAMHMK